jgi:hypothetical protein
VSGPATGRARPRSGGRVVHIRGVRAMKRNSSSQLELHGSTTDGSAGGASTGASPATERRRATHAPLTLAHASSSGGGGLPAHGSNAGGVGVAPGPPEQVQDFRDIDDRPKKKPGPGRPRKDAGLTPEQRKHRRYVRATPLVVWPHSSFHHHSHLALGSWTGPVPQMSSYFRCVRCSQNVEQPGRGEARLSPAGREDGVATEGK